MNVRNRKCIRKLSFRTLWASRKRNMIAVIAIALTTLLFTSLFTIALSINGIGTEGPGDLDITDAAFPDIEAGKNLPINYQAKVAVSKDVKDLSAATVIFTIEAVD